MKKILVIAAAAAAILAGCAKNQVVSTVGEESHAIGFGAYSGRTITKADQNTYIAPGTTIFKDDATIGVFAFMNDAETPEFMNNIEVTLVENGTQPSTEYEPLRYWPKDESKEENGIDFIAYYPYNSDLNVTARYGEIEFEVAQDIENQVDLLYSDAVEDAYYSQLQGIVPFVFHHALTRVLFQVKLSKELEGNVTITVNEMKVDELADEGTLTLADGTWDNVTGGAEYDIPIEDVELTTTAQPIDDNTWSDVFLLMPQDIADASTLYIKYTVSQDGLETVNEASIQFNTIEDKDGNPIDVWSPNQNVIYTIIIGLNPIEFTASVTDWEEKTEGIVEL